MSATIHDVAREAGVSIKTVSRVINGERNVAPATVQLVVEAIAALDYHPNQFARSLRSGASDTIGVVVDSLSDPFFATIISVAERRATPGMSAPEPQESLTPVTLRLLGGGARRSGRF